VRRQKAFFLGFAAAPSPLRMSESAQALDIHEATVSRITSGKYLQCSAGIFALRYFFTNAAVTKTESTNGSASVFSKEEVKNRIKQLIDEAEKSGKKLSDEKISKKLEEYGMSVARRTVSKYRAELKIQSSYDR
ncbi:MAG: RNA polymerase sigma-54 factor, partial [Spirochaetaceae bacterium]|nr:RNA polymerase sigma-54 factor [Spirochaetaceae bacterium]